MSLPVLTIDGVDISVAALRLEEGDIIVLNVDADVGRDYCDQLRVAAEMLFVGHKVVVLSKDVGLSVIADGSEPAP